MVQWEEVRRRRSSVIIIICDARTAHNRGRNNTVGNKMSSGAWTRGLCLARRDIGLKRVNCT